MFNRKCSMIGMVHLKPLPGAAYYGGSIDYILQEALNDAMTYKENGFDALLLENMHDLPYLKGKVEPETTAAMAIAAQAIKYETQMPLGVQLLAGANIDALAAAVAAAADFIRVEGYVFAHVGDEGIHEASAAALIRRRAQLKAERVKIYADVKKKHAAHAITDDVSLEETAQAAEMFLADGVIVTGRSTGHAPQAAEVQSVRAAVVGKVLVGSGVSIDNLASYMPHADALIVGSSLKRDSDWRNEVDANRVKLFIDRVRQIEMKQLAMS